MFRAHRMNYRGITGLGPIPFVSRTPLGRCSRVSGDSEVEIQIPQWVEPLTLGVITVRQWESSRSRVRVDTARASWAHVTPYEPYVRCGTVISMWWHLLAMCVNKLSTVDDPPLHDKPHLLNIVTSASFIPTLSILWRLKVDKSKFEMLALSV